MLKTELSTMRQRVEHIQIENSHQLSKASNLQQKLKKLEYINQKNQDQLKLYQELKYVKAKDKIENMLIRHKNKGSQTMITKTFTRKKSPKLNDSYQD